MYCLFLYSQISVAFTCHQKNHFFQLKITIEIQNELNFRKQLTIWFPSSIDTSPTKTLILRHVKYTRKGEYRKKFSSQRIRTSTMTKYLLCITGVPTEILRIWSHKTVLNTTQEGEEVPQSLPLHISARSNWEIWP